MNAIMASLGGRAPPGQNKLTPCAESRSLVEAPGSRAPGPSASRLCRSERQPAYRCRPPPSSPIPEASVPCSRSWLRSKPPLPIATGAHARGPEPAAPRGNGPQAKTCCLSACSWLHFLKCWSLRQTRRGSSVRLDRFIYDPNRGTGEVILNATRGSFRFSTGAQGSKSYQVKTPYGTLGVRG